MDIHELYRATKEFVESAAKRYLYLSAGFIPKVIISNPEIHRALVFVDIAYDRLQRNAPVQVVYTFLCLALKHVPGIKNNLYTSLKANMSA